VKEEEGGGEEEEEEGGGEEEEQEVAVEDKYTVNTLMSGKPAEMALGLIDFMGIDKAQEAQIVQDPLKAIRDEFEQNGDKDDKDRVRYILDGVAEEKEERGNDGKQKIRDKGYTGKRLNDFADHENARAAQLGLEHIAALRIYTSKSFWRINSPLRNREKPHPFPATTLLITRALSKLRAVHAGGVTAAANSATEQPTEFWRGMKDLRVTPEFMRFGGTELGCMSTTTDLETSVGYACSKCPLVFKIVSTSWTNRGCDIKWLSMYPDEAEVLYPPLTYLKPISKKKINNSDGYLVEAQPEFPGA
jgi:hypothetical protein